MDEFIFECYNYGVCDKMMKCDNVKQMEKLLKRRARKPNYDYCKTCKVFWFIDRGVYILQQMWWNCLWISQRIR